MPLDLHRFCRLMVLQIVLQMAVGAGIIMPAGAEVTVNKLFSNHMVLQRGMPVPVFGHADPGERLTVHFKNHIITGVADTDGNWKINLPKMLADPVGSALIVTGLRNEARFEDVLVGDVWLCSGQSNMAFGLNGCNRPEDIASANFPSIRQFSVPLAFSAEPQTSILGAWSVCTPGNAGSFSATAFYFARKIYQETRVPIGLIVSSVGGTRIDLWLAPEGIIDQPVLHPLLSQKTMPTGPFSLFNGMVYPLAPYGIKGVLWYQGENSEVTVQSADSYYLKKKALITGWERAWGVQDLAFYFVQLANWGPLPAGPTPEISGGRGWDADTRAQQLRAMALPHAGMASAIDIGDTDDMHPRDKMDLGDRLALWALKNDYGRPNLVASGPTLKSASAINNSIICKFDNVGSGLMVGHKLPYQFTSEDVGGKLNRFVIAGADGVWHEADAEIKLNQVVVRSRLVPAPTKVAYAYWQNPVGCNLYNREGLPASPFLVEDVRTQFTVMLSASAGGQIAPSGALSCIPGQTLRCTVRPDNGRYLKDVKVDGNSIGAVTAFTLDPIRTNHEVEAVFGESLPEYTVSCVSGGGGAIAPSGEIKVEQGGSCSFQIRPDVGNLVHITVDGADLGARRRFNLSNIRANHRITVSFACTIHATAGYGGGLSKDGDVQVAYGDKQSFIVQPLPGYSIADVTIDGKSMGPQAAYTFTNVARSHKLEVSFRSTAPSGHGIIPSSANLIVAATGDNLPSVGTIERWQATPPSLSALTAISNPQALTIDGNRFARLLYERGNGFSVGTYKAAIPCNGASITVVVRPVRNGYASAWTSVVDLFYDRLVLGIRNDTGQVCVRRNGSMENSIATIPDGQITILTLIVQADGSYVVYANGASILTVAGNGRFTSITPGVTGPYANSITIGRNAPDGWTAFNGDINCVYLYDRALERAEQQSLESWLANRLIHR